MTVLDGVATGGQAGTSSRIENYLGFPSGISGAELADRAVLQAEKFGARFAVPAEATAIAQDDRGYYRVQLADADLADEHVGGHRHRSPGTVGSRRPLLDYFEKMSVFYAASQAEALMCRGDPVAIVGGADWAGRAAVFLSAHATPLTLIVREHDLSWHMSRWSSTRLRGSRCPGDGGWSEQCGNCTATLRRAGGGHRRRQPYRHAARPSGARALRLHRGRTVTDWLGGLLDLDDDGFVRSGGRCAHGGAGLARTVRGPCRWRPIGLASSPSAMSAAVRPDESPRPSARARWPSGSPLKEPGQQGHRDREAGT